MLRYGRSLNRMNVDHADVKFFIHCSKQLAEADEVFNTANKAAATITNRAGAAARSSTHSAYELSL